MGKRPSLAPQRGSTSAAPKSGTGNDANGREPAPKLPPRRPSELSRTTSTAKDGPPKRPSLAGGRADSSLQYEPPRRPSGLSRLASEAKSRGRGESMQRRPSGLTRIDSRFGPSAAERRPSIAERESKTQETLPRRPSGLSRSVSQAKDSTQEERPSLPDRTTSQATKSAPKRPSLLGRTSTDAQPQRSSRPSAIDTSKAETRPKLPRKSSLISPSSSQGDLTRPRLPSGRRVSFKDDESISSAAPDPKTLPDVAEEDGHQQDNAPLQRPSKTPKKPRSKKSVSKPPAEATQDSASATGPSGTKPDPLGSKVSQSDADAKKGTNDADKPRKPPKLGPKKQPPAKSSAKPIKPKSTSTKKPKPSSTEKGEKKPDTPVTKLAEDDRDLKSVLSEEQCGDLTLLVTDITSRMRTDIESHYDASKGLKLIHDGNSETSDPLEKPLDFDPGTVDIDSYDKERKIRSEQEKEVARPEVKKLKDSNLKWFDEWREEVILRVGEAVNSKQTASDQKKDSKPVAPPSTSQGRQIQKLDAGSKTSGSSGPKLEELFPRIKTPLTKLPMGKRILVLHSVLLLSLGLEHYNAASRVLLLYLTSSLKIGLSSLRDDEETTAQGLLKAAEQMSADEEAHRRFQESNNPSRKWKIRAATAAGAAIIGYTGGLAAPMIAAGVGSIMGEMGLGATAAAGYLGSVASSATVVGTLFGAYGGRMTGQVMENISAGVQDFGFLPIHGERKSHDDSVNAVTNTRRLRVIIAISGWLLEKEEVVTPWRVLQPSAEVFALRFELETLLNLGQSFDTMLQSAVYGYAQSTMIQQTILSELMSGMMYPMALTKVARVVDNPFSLAQTRADKAGQVLADALINHVQGERPVTLIAYSIGARVIYSCLTSLAKRKAFGLVESAVLMGAPIPSDTRTWRAMRATVSGRLVNVYSSNDYLLAFLYRTSSLQYGVAGLVPITGLAGIENVDVTETVSGHLRYRYLVGSILQKIRFEDVDKGEVAKESAAFGAIIEEEQKRTYLQQAGDLYDNYRGKKPQSSSQKKADKQKKQKQKKQMDSISDKDAEKEVTAMEKSVDEKTKSGLMQWAAEQLYLSSPANDKAKDVEAKAKPPQPSGQVETAEPGGNKSYYQWAKEATYLSRSGGPEAESAKKDKERQASVGQPQATKGEEGKNEAKEQPQQAGYLASAAGYIPTGYVPSIRSSGGGSSKKGKKSSEEKKPDETKKKEDEGEGEGEGEEVKSPNISQSISEDSAREEAKGYTSYLPSFGMSTASSAAKKGKGKGKAGPEAPTDDNDDPAKLEQEIEQRASNAGHLSAEEAQAKAGVANASQHSNGEGEEEGTTEASYVTATSDDDGGDGGVATGHASTPDSGGEEDGEGQETAHKGKHRQDDDGDHNNDDEDGEGEADGEGGKATQSNWTTDTENNGEESDDDPFTTPPTREWKGLFGSGSGSGVGKGGQGQGEGEEEEEEKRA